MGGVNEVSTLSDVWSFDIRTNLFKKRISNNPKNGFSKNGNSCIQLQRDRIVSLFRDSSFNMHLLEYRSKSNKIAVITHIDEGSNNNNSSEERS